MRTYSLILGSVSCVVANGAAAEDHDAAATAATLMQEVRALIEPIRTLRGALFALRMALVDAVAEPGTRLAMVPFHDLEPVLHGWIAERLGTARGLSGDSLNDVAAEVGRELAGTRSAGEVAGAFRELARERKLEPQSALSLDEQERYLEAVETLVTLIERAVARDGAGEDKGR